MATAYPAALDTVGSQLRTDIASTDDLDDSGKEHDVMHVNVHGAVVALETKLGIGASAASGASDGDVMTRQADGSTAWEAAAGGGASWSGSTANGLATYGDASTIVAESNATYDGTDLTLTSGNLVVSDGFGIDFSAASNEAGMTSELLDDYEEGTWTAGFGSDGGSFTVSTSYDTGSYTKVGRVVTISGEFYASATSTPTGNFFVTGLPFAAADLDERSDRTSMPVNALYLSSDAGQGIYGQIIETQSQVRINYGAGGTGIGGHMATLVDTGSVITVGGSYFTAT